MFCHMLELAPYKEGKEKLKEEADHSKFGRRPWSMYLRWWQCWELPSLIHLGFLLAILGRAYNTYLVQFLDSFSYFLMLHRQIILFDSYHSLKAIDILAPSCFPSELV